MSTIKAISRKRSGKNTIYIEYSSKGNRKYINSNFKLTDKELKNFNGDNPGKPFSSGVNSFVAKNKRMKTIYARLLDAESKFSDPESDEVIREYNRLLNEESKEVTEQGGINLIELLDEWIETDTIDDQNSRQKSSNTIRTYRLVKTHLSGFLDSLEPEKVNNSLYQSFRDYVYSKDLDTAYFGNLVKNMKVFFKWLETKKEIRLPNYESKHWKAPKPKSDNPIYLEREELLKLIDFKATGRHEGVKDDLCSPASQACAMGI